MIKMTYMDVIYVLILMSFALYMFQSSKFRIQCGYPLYICILLCICFNLTNFGIKFENRLKKVFFFNLDTFKGGGQVTKTASINTLRKTDILKKTSRLTY